MDEIVITHEELYLFAKEFLSRVPECTCGEYYAAYYPRTDPQCALHGHFGFSEEELEQIRKLVNDYETHNLRRS